MTYDNTPIIGCPTCSSTAGRAGCPVHAPPNSPQILDGEAIHGWFGLTYACYLVLPRTALQSMPPEWQRRFVACLEEIEASLGSIPDNGGDYWVQLRDPDGRFVQDDLSDYQRGRRRLLLKAVTK